MNRIASVDQLGEIASHLLKATQPQQPLKHRVSAA